MQIHKNIALGLNKRTTRTIKPTPDKSPTFSSQATTQSVIPISTPRLNAALKAITQIQSRPPLARFGMMGSGSTPILALAPGYEDQYHRAIEAEKHHSLPMGTYMPSVVETTDSGRKVMMDLVSRNFQSNIVYISGPVTSAMADAIKMQFTYLANQMMDDEGNMDPAKVKPVRMIINSPGGEILAMEQILDSMDEVKESGIPIHTYVGFAASAATLIASNGTQGKRFVSPRAWFMIHQPLGGAQGQHTDVEINYKLMTRMKENLIDHLFKATYGKKKLSQVKKDVERDYWMRGEEVVKYGLADHVVTKYGNSEATESHTG